jgi:hypothetical protein
MREFEYKVLPVKVGGGVTVSAEKSAEKIQTELHSLGTEGWELVEVSGNVAVEGFVLLFFKRELNK